MTEEWFKAMNEGEMTHVLMIDLCKAFDFRLVYIFFYQNVLRQLT